MFGKLPGLVCGPQGPYFPKPHPFKQGILTPASSSGKAHLPTSCSVASVALQRPQRQVTHGHRATISCKMEANIKQNFDT